MENMRSKVKDYPGMKWTGRSELDKYFCGICNDLTTKPVDIIGKTSSVGKRFCFDCVNKWVKAFNTYPGHESGSSATARLVPDESNPNVITFHCDFRSDGCEASLTRKEFETHVKNTCPFIPCRICGLKKKEPSYSHTCIQALKTRLNEEMAKNEEQKKKDKEYNELKAKLNVLTEENIGLKKENQELKDKGNGDKNMVLPISEFNTKFDQLKSVLADIEAGLNVRN